MKKYFTLITVFLLIQSGSAQTWEQLNNTPFENHHAIGFSFDGFGYSLTGRYSKDVFKYDPSDDTWEEMADYPGPNRGYGIGDAYEGKLYFGFGGPQASQYLNDLWVFDPVDNTFEELPSCPCTGRLHPAFVILDGIIYMGMGNNTSNLDDWWSYNIAEQTWDQLSDFPAANRHHPYQFAMGEYVYAGLGHGSNFISDEWYRYHPATDVWDQVQSIPAEGRVAGQQFSYEGKGYILSGEGDDHNSMATGEFWEYDPELDEWLELAPHPGYSIWAPAHFMIDNVLYLSSGQVYNPNTGVQGPSLSVYKYEFEVIDYTSIETNSFDASDILISPNPTDGIISISSEMNFDNVTIYDVNGKPIKTLSYSNKSIDVSFLPSGFYILKMENKDDIYFSKITRN